MSGAMLTFFGYPDQWQRLLDDRSLLPPPSTRCSATSRLS